MKIISGKLKGRSISINKKENYRPTLSRIREDLFNLINHNKILNLDLKKSVFCDLFCGSGSIGLEALSRGAKKVIFNDINNLTINTVKDFLVKNKLNNYEIYNHDAYNMSQSIFNNVDIFYIDPPYEYDLNKLEGNIYSLISKNCSIIIETDQELDKHRDLIMRKKYRNKNLFFLRKTSKI